MPYKVNIMTFLEPYIIDISNAIKKYFVNLCWDLKKKKKTFYKSRGRETSLVRSFLLV